MQLFWNGPYFSPVLLRIRVIRVIRGFRPAAPQYFSPVLAALIDGRVRIRWVDS
jgi:hypothetical protein